MLLDETFQKAIILRNLRNYLIQKELDAKVTELDNGLVAVEVNVIDNYVMHVYYQLKDKKQTLTVSFTNPHTNMPIQELIIVQSQTQKHTPDDSVFLTLYMTITLLQAEIIEEKTKKKEAEKIKRQSKQTVLNNDHSYTPTTPRPKLKPAKASTANTSTVNKGTKNGILVQLSVPTSMKAKLDF